MAMISILVTHHYFHCFFSFLSFGLGNLPNRLSSYVLFFSVNKRFQAEKTFKVCGFIHTVLRNHPIFNILNLYPFHFKYITVVFTLKIMHLNIKR